MIQDLFAGVSVDTNVFIHLYKSDSKALLFDSFEKIYAHEYIIETELKKNDIKVYNEFKQDIKNGYIKLITNKDIIQRGVIQLFNDQYDQYLVLFARDRGEAYAIALATAFGIASFISNDVKDGGPHETLVKEYIEGVMPFAYYELLFLEYLKSNISLEEFKLKFELIANTMTSPMRFNNKLRETMFRFLRKDSSIRDKDFMKEFIGINNINLRVKNEEIKAYRSKI